VAAGGPTGQKLRRHNLTAVMIGRNCTAASKLYSITDVNKDWAVEVAVKYQALGEPVPAAKVSVR